MTTINEAREILQEAWVAAWGTTTPYVFDNEAFKEPSTPIPWARFSVRNIGRVQHTLGGSEQKQRIFESDAFVYIQIMAPVNQGMAGGASLAQAARDVFEGKRFGEVVCFEGLVKEARPDGKWYVTLAQIKVQYYEKK